jgi:hypothetical protein
MIDQNESYEFEKRIEIEVIKLRKEFDERLMLEIYTMEEREEKRAKLQKFKNTKSNERYATKLKAVEEDVSVLRSELLRMREENEFLKKCLLSANLSETRMKWRSRSEDDIVF